MTDEYTAPAATPAPQPAPGPAPAAAAGQAVPAQAPPPPAAAPGGEAAVGPEVPSPADSGPHAAAQVALDLDELSARAAERDEYLALAQRTRADFENYRKRVARDAAAAELRGVTRLVRELLPAIDNLERALAAATAERPAGGPDQLVDGMRLVRDDLHAALGRAGVESYRPEGERFDPEYHEAIAQNTVAGVDPGTVVEVYQAGYRLNTSVIRPARVVVAGAPAAAPDAGESRVDVAGGGA